MQARVVPRQGSRLSHSLATPKAMAATASPVRTVAVYAQSGNICLKGSNVTSRVRRNAAVAANVAPTDC